MKNFDLLKRMNSNSVILLENTEFSLLIKCCDRYRCILKTSAFIGKNGITESKKESDGKTPAGIFRIKYAFGLCDAPKTRLKYIKTNEGHYFVDDINSKYYNRLVNINKVKKDWKTAEHISDFKAEYSYAVDIGYNETSEKGRGSAIFLHCKGQKSYTSGCIAISKKELLFCLKYLDDTTIIIIKDPMK